MIVYEREGCWKCDEVREVLDRLGVPHQRVDVRQDPAAGARMKALTGQRLVPALEDGDLVVWDRRRVIRYLEETYGGVTEGTPARDLPAWMGGMRRFAEAEAAR